MEEKAKGKGELEGKWETVSEGKLKGEGKRGKVKRGRGKRED